jgi:hypothetical protein
MGRVSSLEDNPETPRKTPLRTPQRTPQRTPRKTPPVGIPGGLIRLLENNHVVAIPGHMDRILRPEGLDPRGGTDVVVLDLQRQD